MDRRAPQAQDRLAARCLPGGRWSGSVATRGTPVLIGGTAPSTVRCRAPPRGVCTRSGLQHRRAWWHSRHTCPAAGRGHLTGFDPKKSPKVEQLEHIKKAANDYYDKYWKSFWKRLADKHSPQTNAE